MHRLRVPSKLRPSLASTNIIESAFSIVEMVYRNVKRWHGGDQYLRWVASALLWLNPGGIASTDIANFPSWSKNWNWLLSKAFPFVMPAWHDAYTWVACFNWKAGMLHGGGSAEA